MELEVSSTSIVTVDASGVINAMVRKEESTHTVEVDGKYYIKVLEGPHKDEELKPITKEKFDYIRALKTISIYLENNK